MILQNLNLKFDVAPILCARKVTHERKCVIINYVPISTKQVHKIWCKSIHELQHNHILGVGLFFSLALFGLFHCRNSV